MDPEKYYGKEWEELARQLDRRTLRNALRGAYRKEARKAADIAKASLKASGLKVKGNRSDWEKGIRPFFYRNAAGFLITVKGRQAGRGRKGLSMHANRRHGKMRRDGSINDRMFPILQWAEEGTRRRYSGRGKWRTTYSKGGRKAKPRKSRYRVSGIYRGAMRPYRFMEKATPQMFRSVEAGLFPELEKAVRRQAEKAGFF